MLAERYYFLSFTPSSSSIINVSISQDFILSLLLISFYASFPGHHILSTLPTKTAVTVSLLFTPESLTPYQVPLPYPKPTNSRSSPPPLRHIQDWICAHMHGHKCEMISWQRIRKYLACSASCHSLFEWYWVSLLSSPVKIGYWENELRGSLSFLFSVPHCWWDLSSLTRDWTRALSSGSVKS